CTRGLGNAYW
nr:immunoglobulin heavy chain junction region [Mus musculus]